MTFMHILYNGSSLMTKLVSKLFIFAGILFLLVTFGPLIKDELWYYFIQLKGQKYEISSSTGSNKSIFGELLSTEPIDLKPVNKDFSIVIEKIGVNSPIVADVSVSDENAYRESLKHGIAHADTSQYPSKEPGNVYLFAHSSLNFFELGGYATVFNLLKKLNYGDKIHVFYKGDDYIYEVVNKEMYKGWNTFPLVRPVIEPILTLQTCDPPGTTLNRFVVTASLKDTVHANGDPSNTSD